MDFVSSKNISIFFVTETWLTDMVNHTTAVIKSYGYNIHHCYRDSIRGGGVAIIYKPLFKVIRVTVNHNTSFESVTAKVKLQDNSFILCSCIYRADGRIPTFLSDLDNFLGDLFIKAEKLLVCGDFNIHLDVTNSNDTIQFHDIIDSYGLTQFVQHPTHKSGHILDVVIASHNIINEESVDVLNRYSSQFTSCDHYAVLFSLNCCIQLTDNRKIIKFRNYKNVDSYSFKQDLVAKLPKIDSSSSCNFEESITQFNKTCSSVLEKHAPLLVKSIRDIHTSQWFDSDYKAARAHRRKAEKAWNKYGLSSDYDTFCHWRKKCNEIASKKKKTFYQSKLTSYSNSQKSLYNFVNTFLDQLPSVTLPPVETIQNAVNNFNNFFIDKIDKIHASFPKEAGNQEPSCETFKGTLLSSFEPTSISEITEIIKESKIKTSTNDPLPAFILEENIEDLLSTICDLVNLSLKTGSIDGEKTAHLSPLIKNQSLDSSCLKNYRPISNLSFISKLIERVVLRRLNKHLNTNNLNVPLQSAYKKNHSCETLLITIVNDLLIASDANKATIVMLLDLSAAFDTVYHPKLIRILREEIGIRGTALKWFESFICGRCQKVRIQDHESEEIIIKFGVPQGSVLGPVLFNIYIRSIYSTVKNNKFLIHGFADDHQIYKSFVKEQEYHIMVKDLPDCFAGIEEWMSRHYLQLNAGKTEIIVFAKPNVLADLKIHGSFITPSTCIRFVSTAKNLGFLLDSQLAMTSQIKRLKKSSFNTMRKIASMKKFLSPTQCETLIHALVFSALDYCNALYYRINSHNMKQLQMIQNRACRIVLGLNKRQSVDSYLQELHWLKVQERIEFKIVLLTFKCLNGLAPSYLSELLQYNNLSGSRLPSLKLPSFTSSVGDRAFVSSAPLLWNNLPVQLRQCSDIHMFKRHLKTFLFKKSYNINTKCETL